MTFNQNKIISLPEGDIVGGTGSVNLARVSQPVGGFWGWQMVRVNPDNGLIDFLKWDGTLGKPTDPLDRVVIGNPNPKFYGGITNTFNM